MHKVHVAVERRGGVSPADVCASRMSVRVRDDQDFGVNVADATAGAGKLSRLGRLGAQRRKVAGAQGVLEGLPVIPSAARDLLTRHRSPPQ